MKKTKIIHMKKKKKFLPSKKTFFPKFGGKIQIIWFYVPYKAAMMVLEGLCIYV
jgi:hypothetical protein